jgi:quercetin 2,3-dioxygenase
MGQSSERVENGGAGYQTIQNAEIPAVDLDGGAGRLRVIAGSVLGAKAGADVHPGGVVRSRRENTSILVLQGRASVNQSRQAGEAELIVCKRNGSEVVIDARQDSRLLLMSGASIEEPIARDGPFVMNTRAELLQAVEDYQTGKMEHVS